MAPSSGSSVSFEEFAVARTPALVRFAYVLTGDGGLAEDLVQEVLVRVHRRWDRVAVGGHPEAYVRRSLVNEATSWRRRRRNREYPGPVPELASGDGADLHAEHDVVWRVLGELPRQQRVVLVLRYYEALSDAEIAATLGCAESTIRSLASRAFAVLRRHPDLAVTASESADPAPTPTPVREDR
jgi:RNA polymerase sigma-70 factor (sigma-E family)